MKMSLTRILAEIKILAKSEHQGRIPDLMSNFVGMSIGLGNSQTPHVRTFKNKDQVEKEITSQFKSWEDQMARLTLLKRTLNHANSTTMVTIGSKTMTIAEAVEQKAIMVHKSKMIQKMKNILLQTQTQMDQYQAKWDQTVQASMSNVKVEKGESPDLMANATAAMRETLGSTMKPHLIDPLNLGSLIKRMEEEVNDFLLNVDFALSEINAKTEVEV